MVSTRRQKQALSIVSNPLKIEVILHQVFSFLPGNWLYLGAVCKEWRDVYAGREGSEVRSFHFFNSRDINVACGPKMTLYSVAVASPLTVRMAHSCGLAMDDNYHLELRAVTGGSVEVVDWLQQEQRVVIGADFMAAAAGAGQIAMCKHLHSIGCKWSADACTEAGCPWDCSQVFIKAACRGYIDILDYVIVQGELPDAELLTDTLYYAGLHDQLQAVQWLRQHGAQWPEKLISSQKTAYWSGPVLAWARSEGCTSPGYLDVDDSDSDDSDEHIDSNSDSDSSDSDSDYEGED
eukprot:20945-Heterococcus_DN1.PRE.4